MKSVKTEKVSKTDKKNGQPEVSIIIPAYNTDKYVIDCLDSVRAQKGIEKSEIIIVNDASSDLTANKLEKYLQNRRSAKNVKVINNKFNLGVSASRNVGMNLATGRYMMFVDSDDIIGFKPNKSDCINTHYLESFKYCLDEHPTVAFSAGHILPIDKDGVSPIFTDQANILAQKLYIKNLNYAQVMNFIDLRISACSVMYRNSVISDNMLRFNNNMFYFEDADFITRYIFSSMQQYKIAMIGMPEGFYGYRRRPDSAMTKLVRHSEKHMRRLKRVKDKIFYYGSIVTEAQKAFGDDSEIFNIFAHRFARGVKKIEKYSKENKESYKVILTYVPKKCIGCIKTNCTKCDNKNDLLKVAKLARERLGKSK